MMSRCLLRQMLRKLRFQMIDDILKSRSGSFKARNCDVVRGTAIKQQVA
jgi:hypothetical protein